MAILKFDHRYKFFSSFETTFWKKPGSIEREALLDLVADKDALFCLSHDKINQELIHKAPSLKVIGKNPTLLRNAASGANSISTLHNFKAPNFWVALKP